MERNYSNELLAMMPFADMLGKEIPCSCGKVHRADIDEIVIGKGAVSHLTELLRHHGYQSVFMLEDPNTHRAGGEKAAALLKENGFTVYEHIYDVPQGAWLAADEKAMDEGREAFEAIAEKPDVILAVGTGTINDLSKEIASHTAAPQWVIATAGSMDGYASNVAALVRNNLKVTEYYAPPRVIICDTEIAAAAPKAMTVAGICDMAAKYNANMEWRLDNLINGTAFCDFVSRGMLEATDSVIDLALEEGAEGEFSEEFYERLMRGLVLSGIYMAYQGLSSPASGSEHHISHFLEMWLQVNNKPAVYHGTKVGVGALIMNRLDRVFLDLKIEARRVIPRLQRFDEAAYREQLQKVFGKAAPAVLENYHWDAEERIQRLNIILEKRRQINSIIREMLPSFDKMKRAMEQIGAVMDWTGIPFVTGEIAREALLYAKEVRSRYTMLQILTDAGYHFEKFLPELTQNGCLRLDQIQMRDPFVLPVPEEDKYYLFGTTDPSCWVGPFIGFDCFESTDLIHWNGPHAAFRPDKDFWGTCHYWAPEVHKYHGKYYMFATFDAENVTKGTAILRSDRPEGPYIPLTDSHITPQDWVCLDGTLFVDGKDQPWIVFCHEWAEIIDGTICAMPLNSSLTAPVGEPVVLFHASDAPWTEGRPWKERVPSDESGRLSYVTDGPFIVYADETHEKLVMLWSSRGPKGYANGSAYSENGILGPWRQNEELAFEEDGGHGMVFESLEGQLMMTLHKPNQTPNERPFFFPARLEDGKILLDTGKTIGREEAASESKEEKKQPNVSTGKVPEREALKKEKKALQKDHFGICDELPVYLL